MISNQDRIIVQRGLGKLETETEKEQDETQLQPVHLGKNNSTCIGKPREAVMLERDLEVT